jgi:hypothetical protein
LALVAILSGCSMYFGGDDAPSDPGGTFSPDAGVFAQPDAAPSLPTPGDCREHFTLYGMDTTNGHVTLGPLALDTQGVTLCLTLDATDNIWVAHFGADTDREQTTTSSYQLTLFDAQGTLLQDGWDVTFGNSQPTTFENLEYGVTAGMILEAKLVVRMRAGSGSTNVGLDLFEPYE